MLLLKKKENVRNRSVETNTKRIQVLLKDDDEDGIEKESFDRLLLTAVRLRLTIGLWGGSPKSARLGSAVYDVDAEHLSTCFFYVGTFFFSAVAQTVVGRRRSQPESSEITAVQKKRRRERIESSVRARRDTVSSLSLFRYYIYTRRVDLLEERKRGR